MKNLNFLLTVICSVSMLNSSIAQKSTIIKSPDNKIAAEVLLNKDQQLVYNIRYLNVAVLQNSSLGIVREDADFSMAMQWVTVSDQLLIKDNYRILTAKKSSINYSANRKVITVKNKEGNKMNIVFQVSNDGVAFRYEFTETSTDIKKIKQEATSFHFYEGTKAWLQPKTEAQSGWEHSNPSYEAHYMMDIKTGTPAPGKNGWIYPAMFHYKNTWMLITEAALGRTYCGTALQQFSENNEYKINFPQEAEKFTNGALFPQSTLPWQMPWRIIAIGSLKTIAESTLGTDLAFPAKRIDAEFIKPGRASWSWIMSKDDYIVYAEQKKYIDYAADMHWEYCLIDADWDRKIGYDKIKELADYATTKKVGLLLWYNSAGAWNTVKYTPKDKMLTHESRIKEFAVLQKMGIKGIKTDFFAGDGQSMINYYQDILEDAATYHLLVNFHGATLPRGWQRTYPNLMTTEAVYGYEMITFGQKDADLAAPHMVMSAFARNAFDPMDFTPVSLYKIPRINRKTSSAFELATSVIFLSGIQHYVEGPDGMAKMPAAVKEYMQTVPVAWDEVKFIDGYPGKFYAVARRAGKKWYVAAINGDTVQKQIPVDVSRIAAGKTGTIFRTNERGETVTENYPVKQGERKAISVNPNDGFVIVFE
ncbi:MAG: glycoside hydrolase family 97 catalytic domain-containing protein [Chitinophagaceae bacterium]|nr:glycoside hydrolase family 97 catalytic domain-containing protein [Chitinophagaceae bacterium]